MQKFFSLFFMLLLLLSFTVLLAEQAPEDISRERQTLIRQQMILFGLYIYGLNTELAQKIPNSDEVNFLSETLLEAVRRVRETKGDDFFHKNILELEFSVIDLQRSARKSSEVVKIKIRNVIDQCAKCHMVSPGEVQTRNQVPRKEFLQTER
jgi:hypothetical protein